MRAEFEEKEFEAPLYNQLEVGTHLVWTPGQVFEEHIGIDRALFTKSPRFWNLLGYSSHMQGAFINRYNWDYIWIKRKSKRILPNFKLNLFIQAKRPYHYKRIPRTLLGRRIKAPLWKIELVSHQQHALERVGRNLRNRALVCYAAPVFHRLSQLYAHTRMQTMIENTSFPTAVSLKGHSAWYYNKPGAIGTANNNIKEIEGLGLVENINNLVSENYNKERQSSLDNLRYLAKVIENTLSEEVDEEDARRSEFFSQLFRIEKELEKFEILYEPLRLLLTIFTFNSIYNLQWYVLG